MAQASKQDSQKHILTMCCNITANPCARDTTVQGSIPCCIKLSVAAKQTRKHMCEQSGQKADSVHKTRLHVALPEAGGDAGQGPAGVLDAASLVPLLVR
jgi:hypothetical protein